LIGAAAAVLIVLIIYVAIVLSGSRQFPSLVLEVFKVFRLQTSPPPGPEEPRYSLDFDDQPLTWAVERLRKMAPEVNIVLRHDVASGAVPTKRLSLHLRDARIEELLDALCANAATTMQLRWRRDGKNVVIEPQS